ncbi:hypothetical protein [Cohaesibacter intestini]|uniref:hypothetical protein n=1 Tax=Cohaesibacter intestini TaxID=2211145 RepID=UPI001300A565|nr:hypothetical protein [Cohaesibacter intestini]
MIEKVDKITKLSASQIILLLILVLPVTIVAIYTYLFASDRYESTASVYITEEQSVANPFDLSLIGISSSGSTREILVLKSFIESLGMLLKLDNDLGVLDHFASRDADFFSRLSSDAPKEYALEYYNDRVQASLDTDAKLLEISVQAYDPDYAKQILERILFHSQKFIDELNENITNSQMTFFEGAVKRSEEELLEETKKLQVFQQKNKVFSTELATQTIMNTIGSLEQQLAAKQAELAAREGALSKQAPTLVRLRAEIDALEKQIASENERLSGGTGRSLSELDLIFKDIQLRIEYKTLRYKSHLESYEKAQLDTARRLRFLTIVSAPSLPEAALYPKRAYILVTSALLCLVVYFVVSISFAIIREHA